MINCTYASDYTRKGNNFDLFGDYLYSLTSKFVGYIASKFYSVLSTEDEIVSAVRIDPFDCYYWDAEENDYVPYVVEYPMEGPVDPESSLKRMYGLLSLSKDMDRAFRQLDQAARKLKVMEIRSWLLVNAKCDGAVYVDSDYGIRCQGTIEVMPGVDMPDVIADGLAKGQK